jgi:CRP/FNR family cyclic AMP-dependent transcriptional regulator
MAGMTPEQLQAVSLFQSLSIEHCARLLDRHLESGHAAEQVIVMEQDWGESLFLMRQGMAKVRTFTADGDEVVMALLGAGDVFGEMAALDGTPRSADVVALTSLTVVKLRAAPFSDLLHHNASLALALARLEAARLRDMNRRLSLQWADATIRLLDALAYLARCGSADQDPRAPIPPLAQREMGVLAGLARETASRTLSKLRARGTVEERDGLLRIVDLQPLIKRGLLPPAGRQG